MARATAGSIVATRSSPSRSSSLVSPKRITLDFMAPSLHSAATLANIDAGKDGHGKADRGHARRSGIDDRSDEHTSELQSLMRLSYAVFCLKKKNTNAHKPPTRHPST